MWDSREGCRGWDARGGTPRGGIPGVDGILRGSPNPTLQSGCAPPWENYCAKCGNVRMGWEGRGTHPGASRALPRRWGSEARCLWASREKKRKRGTEGGAGRAPPGAAPGSLAGDGPGQAEPTGAPRPRPHTCRAPPSPCPPLSAPGRGQHAEWQSVLPMDRREAAGRDESLRSDSAGNQWSGEKRRGGRVCLGLTEHAPNGKAGSCRAGRRARRDQWPRRPRPLRARGVAAPPGAVGATGAARAAPAPGERRRGPLPSLPSLAVLSRLLSNPSLPLSPRRLPARPLSRGCPALCGPALPRPLPLRSRPAEGLPAAPRAPSLVDSHGNAPPGRGVSMATAAAAPRAVAAAAALVLTERSPRSLSRSRRPCPAQLGPAGPR